MFRIKGNFHCQMGGFSLVELLIALLIVGQIATFTIPKVVMAREDQHKRAVLKETVAMLSSVLYTGISTGQITNGANLQSYFLSNVNAIKICPTDVTTEGCWDPATQGQSGAVDGSVGFVLSNGVTLADFDDSLDTGSDGIHIDYNGTKGPNLPGEDQMKVMLCVVGPCTKIAPGRPMSPGSIGPPASGPSYIAIYDWVFK